jgi:hypothetical protein
MVDGGGITFMSNRELLSQKNSQEYRSNKKGITLCIVLALIALLPLLAFFFQFSIKDQRPIALTPAIETESCNHTGRTQNTDGTYTFARLHVDENGTLVDDTACAVYLLGGQGRQIGQQKSGYTVTNPQEFGYLAQLNQTVPMNLLRVPFNPDNWNQNTYLSAAQMGYQDLLKSYITAIEGQGDFVELDKYNGSSLDAETTALQSMASYYANDPAIIFDVRNEGFSSGEQNPYNDDKAWLDAVQANNPDAIKVTYNHYTDEMMAGKLPLFTHTNLLFDDHLYSGFRGTNPDTNQHCDEPNARWQNHLSTVLPPKLTFLHQNHIGFIFNEWGGCYDEPTYNDAMMNFTLQNHIAGLSYYFAPANWFFHKQPAQNATRTGQAYATIFASDPAITPTPTSSVLFTSR